MKMAGVPVELKVATIFAPMRALLPTPLMTTLPFEFKILLVASANCSSSLGIKFAIAPLSVSMVLFAMDIIDEVSFKAIFELSDGIPKKNVLYLDYKIKQTIFYSFAKTTPNHLFTTYTLFLTEPINTHYLEKLSYKQWILLRTIYMLR